jgi:hypothetical protein
MTMSSAHKAHPNQQVIKKRTKGEGGTRKEIMAGVRTRISKNANVVSSESVMRLWNYLMQIFILLSVESESVLCIQLALLG